MTTLPKPSRKSFPEIVLNFSVSWFTINMATGVFSIVLYLMPFPFNGVKKIAAVFYVMNCVLFVAFLLMSIARYIFYPYTFKSLIRHPAQSMFIGTIPMGLSTIINGTVLIAVPAYGQWAITLAWTLWWIDLVLILLSCFGVPFMMFNSHQHKMDKMTAGWLLPILPAVVGSASGGLVAQVIEPDQAHITLVISYSLWGLGMGLSVLIMALYLYRLTIHRLPEPDVVVTAFLPLSPLGQGGFGLIQMATAGRKVFAATDFLKGTSAGEIVYVISVIVALLMWGWGLWWLVHGITSVLARFVKGKIPFSIRFWSMIFPVGVFTASTIALGKVLTSAFFSYFAMVLIGCMTIAWLLIALWTLKGMINQSLFVAPEISELKRKRTQSTEDIEANRLSMI